MKTHALFSSTALLVVTGCASLAPPATDPVEPIGITLPEAYDHSPVVEAARNGEPEWWASFNDPVMNDLIDQALAENLTLESGLANLRSARAAITSSRSSLLPSLSAGASASTNSNNLVDNFSDSGRLSASYEVDLFGANRQSVAVSELGLQAAELDQRALELTVQSSVANAYLNLLSARYSLQIALENLEISERINSIVEARYNAGDVSGYDLATQRSSLASARARIPQIEDQIEGFEAALAILIGAPPQGFSVPETSLLNISVPGVSAGLPSDLLHRRPDLLSAETSLQAAQINVDIAQKAFLPTFDLGSGVSTALTSGLDPVATLSASMSLPLFTGGQLEGQLESAEARADQALTSYRQAILAALQDVDVGLSGLKSANLQEPDLREAETASERALEIAELRYRVGADDLTSLLNAQTTYRSAVQSVVENKRDQLISVVNIYAAIGGGWAG
ncbi:MAG: RND transporter [Ponticaulis sp.]|nr:RND transporter [Ponticaulis sp.]